MVRTLPFYCHTKFEAINRELFNHPLPAMVETLRVGLDISKEEAEILGKYLFHDKQNYIQLTEEALDQIQRKKDEYEDSVS